MAPRSPLHGVELPEGLRELPLRAQVSLRAELPGLPGPGTALRDGERTTLWLGPDEWLVTGPPGTAAEIERELRDAIAATGGWGAVTDVSAQRTTLLVTGPRARDLLSHGCPLDLHPRAFGAGRCAQTTLGRTQIVLVARDEPRAGFWVLVRSSFAGYLTDWLLDAATEYLD